MTGHLTEDQFRKYKSRKIRTSELLAIGDHLAQCKDCREKLGKSEERAAILQSLTQDVQSALARDSQCLIYQQVIGYITGTLNPVEMDMVHSHLGSCERCKSEWADLALIQKQLKAKQVSQITFASRFSFQKIAAMLPGIIRIGAALLVFGLLVAIPFQLQINNLKWQLKIKDQQIANLQKRNFRQTSSRIELKDGSSRISVDEKGNVWSLRKFLPQQEQLIRAALIDHNLRIPSFVYMLIGAGQNGLKTSIQKEQSLLKNPIGTAVISQRPAFQWNSFPGAKSYIVRVYDADNNRVVESPELNGTSWTSKTALERGKNYSWAVTAKDSNEILAPVAGSEAKFRVLSQKEVDEVNYIKQQYPDSHLLLALTCVKNGLIDDAEQQLKIVKLENPNSSPVETLLYNVQSLRSNHNFRVQSSPEVVESTIR